VVCTWKLAGGLAQSNRVTTDMHENTEKQLSAWGSVRLVNVSPVGCEGRKRSKGKEREGTRALHGPGGPGAA